MLIDIFPVLNNDLARMRCVETLASVAARSTVTLEENRVGHHRGAYTVLI